MRIQRQRPMMRALRRCSPSTTAMAMNGEALEPEIPQRRPQLQPGPFRCRSPVLALALQQWDRSSALPAQRMWRESLL
jgi:hypothetical protein